MDGSSDVVLTVALATAGVRVELEGLAEVCAGVPDWLLLEVAEAENVAVIVVNGVVDADCEVVRVDDDDLLLERDNVTELEVVNDVPLVGLVV